MSTKSQTLLCIFIVTMLILYKMQDTYCSYSNSINLTKLTNIIFISSDYCTIDCITYQLNLKISIALIKAILICVKRVVRYTKVQY